MVCVMPAPSYTAQLADMLERSDIRKLLRIPLKAKPAHRCGRLISLLMQKRLAAYSGQGKENILP